MVTSKITHDKMFHKASRLLSRLGVTANYAGFYQTAYALALSVREPDRLLFITKWLYPDAAVHYETNVRCIERNIRTVANVSWRKNSQLLSEIAEYPLSAKPGNAEFLAILATYLSDDHDFSEE